MSWASGHLSGSQSCMVAAYCRWLSATRHPVDLESYTCLHWRVQLAWLIASMSLHANVCNAPAPNIYAWAHQRFGSLANPMLFCVIFLICTIILVCAICGYRKPDLQQSHSGTNIHKPEKMVDDDFYMPLFIANISIHYWLLKALGWCALTGIHHLEPPSLWTCCYLL